MTVSNPVFCAIDTPDLAKGLQLAKTIRPFVYGFKLGLEFFMAHGTAGYRAFADLGAPLFLDLKLHDIPNTVAGAVTSLLSLEPAFLTLHSSGGPAMMEAAMNAAHKSTNRPKILGVTLLTSLDTLDLAAIGQDTDTARHVARLGKLAATAGLDGIVCSPEEITLMRHNSGPAFLLMVPGIRPLWAVTNDQKRVRTPREAMTDGANYLVIGRPITGAADPAEAAQRIQAELA